MSNRSIYDDMHIGDVFQLDLGGARVRIDTIEEMKPVFDGPRGADTVGVIFKHVPQTCGKEF
jgi:hypothetical protein